MRQTRLKTLEEPVRVCAPNEKVGAYTARFGEIEQRGTALNPKGRQAYNALLEGLRWVTFTADVGCTTVAARPGSHRW
ncbi:2-oxoadipate dioxygenase/decarboxylase family protein [Variovorax sp. E3]|uniref:2-oxoadipate dioxygenase/decarboxylase family protein n=1 Tax=Variovorax sp. E3 TaxID=1914993 RepID=UPI0022B5F806|nr:DUF1338 family protein [Variovorax sp. E3]